MTRRLMASGTTQGAIATQAVTQRLSDCIGFLDRSASKLHVPITQAAKAVAFLGSGGLHGTHPPRAILVLACSTRQGQLAMSATVRGRTWSAHPGRTDGWPGHVCSKAAHVHVG